MCEMFALGVIACFIGVLMIFEVGFFRGLEDIGVVVFIIGFLSLSVWFMSISVNAEEEVVEPEVINEETGLSLEPREIKKYPYVDDTRADLTEDDIELLARLITAEVGYATNYDPLDYEQMCYLTGSVVINRINSSKFPNTLKDVIYQSGQYQCVDNGHISREYDDVAWEVAEELLVYGTTIDESVVFQSEFQQGSGIYLKIGNQYFCYSGD